MTTREPCSSMCLSICERNYVSPPYAQLLSLWVIKASRDGLLVVGDWFAQLGLRSLIWISQSPYELFRNMNYYDMNAPFLENFFNAVKGAALKPCTAILGEHAIHVSCKKKVSEGEMLRISGR